MKSILFQLVYHAASTVLSLYYANKYHLGKSNTVQGRKLHVMKDALTREDHDRGRMSHRHREIILH